MYKLSLVLLLVSSAFLCQADNSAVPLQNDSTSKATTLEIKTLSSTTPHVITETTRKHEMAKEESTTNSTKSNSSHVIEGPGPIPPNSTTTSTTPATSSTSTTTTTPITTPTTKPSSTTITPKPPAPSPSPSPSTTTLHPPSTTASPKPNSDGGFNLISFLGGMILGLGLLAIGYVVFKFYQTRRDSSYRTL